jgi:beta-fructofuranosidase
MKVAQFGADRQIGVAWIANGTFGGELLFRELTQAPDGTLGTKFVPEMIPVMDSRLPWRAAPMTAGVSVASDKIVIHSVEGAGAAYIDNVPQNARITAKITGKGAFGIVLRSDGSMEGGVVLRLIPALHRAEWLPAGSNSLASEPTSSINGVDGLDRSVDLDVIAKDDIFDASINGTRTLVRKEAGLSGNRLFFYVQGGELTISNLAVRPLR